ncbi:NAD nucleotidase [Oceanivirga miroungae]|uniref:Adenosine synthase A n=1 Tax=Oceanivirga miroungae TaxID=1130046 RepID=A0A6I8MBB7_9FUSO|nr:NAD nucleotidase [Oceanivirga miroungae]VWL84775.1 Adenosine synthase A [Oceanivirga miroungae]
MKKSLFLAILPFLASVSFSSKPLDLNILHINDHHSHLEPIELDFKIEGKKTRVKIGGYPEVVSIIKNLKKEHKNTLVLHAGDAITGTLYFTLFRGSADAKLMNLTGFDYFTLGNHEFDAGNEGLKKFLDYLDVPVLSANVLPQKGSILENYWKPYAIKEIDGEKVGIIGLDVVKKTKESSSPGKDIVFTDEIETSQKYADILKEKGVNKIILLSHGGAYKNFEIAQKVSGIDVIITGDTHHLFGNDEMRNFNLPVVSEYPTKFTSLSGEPVYVVEAWEYSKLVGDLFVKFNKDGIVEKVEAKPVIPYHLDSSFRRKDENGKKYIPEGAERENILKILNSTKTFKVAKADKEAKEILEKYQKEKEVLGGQVVGVIKGSVMPGGSANRIPNSANEKGSVATRFVAETMLTQMRSFGENAKIDLTIQNSGGVRQDITPGEMTFNDAYTLLPFGNTLFMFDMSGEEVKQVLEDALEFALVGGSTGAFPYGAGIRYEANQYKDKNGKRLVKVEVQDAKTGVWNEIVDNKMYKVGTNAYVAGGKDGYTTFGRIQKERGGEDTYLPDAESLIKFIQLNKDFKTYTDSNVIFHFDINNEVKKK